MPGAWSRREASPTCSAPEPPLYRRAPRLDPADRRAEDAAPGDSRPAARPDQPIVGCPFAPRCTYGSTLAGSGSRASSRTRSGQLSACLRHAELFAASLRTRHERRGRPDLEVVDVSKTFPLQADRSSAGGRRCVRSRRQSRRRRRGDPRHRWRIRLRQVDPCPDHGAPPPARQRQVLVRGEDLNRGRAGA